MTRPDAWFGLTGEEWATAQAETREAILEAAYERRMTSYSEVASQIRSVGVDPHSALMSHLLGAIFEAECEAGRPALTSIVTHKDGDKEPGPGFYQMARSLGYRFDEPFVFWAEQVQKVFTRYGRPTRTGPRTAT